MTHSQVRYLLGTPMVPGAFDNSRWDYSYYLKTQRLRRPGRGHVASFSANDLVARVDSDVTRALRSRPSAKRPNCARAARLRRALKAQGRLPRRRRDGETAAARARDAPRADRAAARGKLDPIAVDRHVRARIDPPVYPGDRPLPIGRRLAELQARGLERHGNRRLIGQLKLALRTPLGASHTTWQCFDMRARQLRPAGSGRAATKARTSSACVCSNRGSNSIDLSGFENWKRNCSWMRQPLLATGVKLHCPVSTLNGPSTSSMCTLRPGSSRLRVVNCVCRGPRCTVRRATTSRSVRSSTWAAVHPGTNSG
jgi:hypothetical protein